jgi:hypothetical protein
MPRKRFTTEQIGFALRQAENGTRRFAARWASPSRRSTGRRSSLSDWACPRSAG